MRRKAHCFGRLKNVRISRLYFVCVAVIFLLFWRPYIGSCAGNVTYRKMAVRAESAKGTRKLFFFCGHCGDYVAKRTFYQHRRLYFDTKLKEWKQKLWCRHHRTATAQSSSVQEIRGTGNKRYRKLTIPHMIILFALQRNALVCKCESLEQLESRSGLYLSLSGYFPTENADYCMVINEWV